MDNPEYLPSKERNYLINSLDEIRVVCENGALNTVLGLQGVSDKEGEQSPSQLDLTILRNVLNLLAVQKETLVEGTQPDFVDHSIICCPDVIPESGIAYSGVGFGFEEIKIVGFVQEASTTNKKKRVVFVVSDQNQSLLVQMYSDGVEDRHKEIFVFHQTKIRNMKETLGCNNHVVGEFPDVDEMMKRSVYEEGYLGYLDLIKYKNEYGYVTYTRTAFDKYLLDTSDKKSMMHAFENWPANRVPFIYSRFRLMVAEIENPTPNVVPSILTEKLRQVYRFEGLRIYSSPTVIEELLQLRSQLIEFYSMQMASVAEAVDKDGMVAIYQAEIRMLNAFMAYMEEAFGYNFFNEHLDWTRNNFSNKSWTPMMVSKLFKQDVANSDEDAARTN